MNNWEDDPTEGFVQERAKSKKTSVKELQQQIDILEMRLILAEPEQIAELRQSHRLAQLHIRDLRFFLDGIERAIIRMHARLVEVDATHPDLEELKSLFCQCQDRLYVNLFPEQETHEHPLCDCGRDVRTRRTLKKRNERAEQPRLFEEEE